MKEEQLLITHHVGDVINILQRTTHHLFDPEELLTVTHFSAVAFFFFFFGGKKENDYFLVSTLSSINYALKGNLTNMYVKLAKKLFGIDESEIYN